jgi:hypothetical protein
MVKAIQSPLVHNDQVTLAEQTIWLSECFQAMDRSIPSAFFDKLEGFLSLNDREILKSAGKVSADLAKQYAEGEFAKYRVLEDARFDSDFDRMVKSLPAPKDKPA